MTDCLHCKLKETLADWLLEATKHTGGTIPVNDVVAGVALVLGQVIASAENGRDRLVLLMVASNVMKTALAADDAAQAEKADAELSNRGTAH